MRISDLLIIYFSIGAPFGVRAYFQNGDAPWSGAREKKSLRKAALTFLFWLPAAIHYFGEREFFPLNDRQTVFSVSNGDKTLDAIQKRFENSACPRNGARVSIFETRETLRRYIGLTVAARRAGGGKRADANVELFRAAGFETPELAAKCFYRRNRERLFFHQSRAQTDFLQLCKILFNAAGDLDGNSNNSNNLFSSAAELAETLGDETARRSLDKIFAELNSPQKRLTEKNLENDLWKAPAPKPPIIVRSILTTSIHAAATTTGSPKKD